MNNDNSRIIGALALLGIVVLIILLILGWRITQFNLGPVVVEPPLSKTSKSGQEDSFTPITSGTLDNPIITDSPGINLNTPDFTPTNTNCTSNGLIIEGNGNCSLINNTINIQAMPQLRLIAYKGNNKLHDFSIEVKIKLVQSGNNAQYGLIARRFDDCQFYLLLITPIQNKLELKEYLCDEGGYKTLYSSILPNIPSSEDSFKLEITGGQEVLIVFSLNNKEIFRYIDNVSIIWQGDAGLLVEDAIVQFSDLTIIPPP